MKGLKKNNLAPLKALGYQNALIGRRVKKPKLNTLRAVLHRHCGLCGKDYVEGQIEHLGTCGKAER